MNNTNTNRKFEIIEQALQEAVSGGAARDIPVCSISCHVFSINVCYVDLCDIPTLPMTRAA
jgi:hypothetical protein